MTFDEVRNELVEMYLSLWATRDTFGDFSLVQMNYGRDAAELIDYIKPVVNLSQLSELRDYQDKIVSLL